MTAKFISDGFGSAWSCPHNLPDEWCGLEVVRPGKCQCVCDSGLESLLVFHYERGKKEAGDAVLTAMEQAWEHGLD